MKDWITNNLIKNGKLISKRCKKEWFERYGYIIEYNKILEITSFLKNNVTISQRSWHIINNIFNKNKCLNPSCNNSTTFFTFTKGYLETCSPTCAQYNPVTINKIKSTNIEKYGSEYGLSNQKIINKRNKTVKEKYGVENVSQIDGISEKKKETCLKNYGVEWFLERQDLKENFVREKYNVNNIQSVKDISEKTSKTKKDNFFDELIESDRFHGKVEIQCRKEDYKGTNEDYIFKCTYCSKLFSYNLRWGRIPRCLDCYPSSGTSLFEQEIKEFIEFLLPDNEVIGNTRSVLLSKKELDIYIPSKNLAIECNGLYWHGEIIGNKDKNYHLSKLIESNNKGIKLIHIFEDEWSKNKNIIKSKIKHILRLNNTQKIYARKCQIHDTSILEKKLFLNNNHIQGNDTSSIYVGLYYNKELVSVMTFCKRRIFMNPKNQLLSGEYELSRYASLKDCNVIGGASKLLSYFIKTYNPIKIISYADRRWSSGNLYEKIGFKKVSDGIPNYWYFNRGKRYKRHHRFGFAKHTLNKKLQNFNPILTEWENMKNNGWDRIWDCGNLKYEWNTSVNH